MPGEKIPTSGGENQENEKSREQMVEELDNIDVDILAAAAKDLGLEDSLAYTYEDDMNDAQLDAFFKKAKSIQSGAGEENNVGGAEPENNPEPEDDNESGDNDWSYEPQSQNEVENGSEKKELSNEEKKKLGAGLSAKAKRLAVLGVIGTLAVGTAIGAAVATAIGGDRNKQKALGKLEGQTGITLNEGEDDGATETDAGGGESEAEHVYGERYEDIEAVTTTHGHYANEDGTGANEKKDKPVCFDEGFESTTDEDKMKANVSEVLVQSDTLATYYSEFGYEASKAGIADFGVEGVDYTNANDVKKAIEGDSEAHQKVYDYVYDVINDDDTHITEETRTGEYNNFYITADFSQGDLDESHASEIVACKTVENDTKVYHIEFAGDNGSKADVDLKEACTQPIRAEYIQGIGWIVVEEDPMGTDISIVPPKKTPTPEDNSKNAKAAKENSGNSGQRDVDEKTDSNATNEDSDGDGVNDADEFNSEDGNDGSTGGQSPDTQGQDGQINKKIQEADQGGSGDDSSSAEQQAARKAEEEAEAARKKQDAEAKSEADKMQNSNADTNNDGVVSADEALQ